MNRIATVSADVQFSLDDIKDLLENEEEQVKGCFFKNDRKFHHRRRQGLSSSCGHTSHISKFSRRPVYTNPNGAMLTHMDFCLGFILRVLHTLTETLIFGTLLSALAATAKLIVPVCKHLIIFFSCSNGLLCMG